MSFRRYQPRRYQGRPNWAGSSPPKVKSQDPTRWGMQAKLCQDIATYQGVDPIIRSFVDQLKKWGLTEKQWRVADRHFNGTQAAPQTVGKVLPIPTPIPFEVTRTVAFKQIRDPKGLKYGIFALKASEVSQAFKARNGNIKLRVKVTPDADSPVSCCRICGKTLVIPNSINSGIGPECAKRHLNVTGLAKMTPAQLAAFKKDFATEVAKLGEFEIDVWSNQIKGDTQWVNTLYAMYNGNIQHPSTGSVPVASPVNPVPPQPVVSTPSVANAATNIIQAAKAAMPKYCPDLYYDWYPLNGKDGYIRTTAKNTIEAGIGTPLVDCNRKQFDLWAHKSSLWPAYITIFNKNSNGFIKFAKSSLYMPGFEVYEGPGPDGTVYLKIQN